MSVNTLIPRLRSLDVFRGITIVLMIIVNSPGNPMPYGWLEHAAWDGCTLADVVFPFFIIIVGISAVLALSNLSLKGVTRTQQFQKIIRRSVYIFLMGLLLNAFPHHLTDWSHLRMMGVLQRIAICYFVSATLFLTTSIQTQRLIALGLWVLYGFTPWLFGGELVGMVDRWVLSPEHLYTSTFDPEGILSTIPAIVSVLLGNIIGAELISKKSKQQHVMWMCVLGGVLMSIGWGLSFISPINKSLWSSAYVLWTGGIFLLSYLVIYLAVEVKAWPFGANFFNLFGRHALLVYMLHVLFLKLQAMVHLPNAAGDVVSLRVYLTEVLFGYLSPQNASLCYSISYTALWFFVLLGVQRLQAHRLIKD